MILALMIGLGGPALAGWMLIRLLEGSAPVLGRYERWLAAAVLGPTLATFVEFLLLWSGLLRITQTGVLVCYLLLLAVLGFALWLRRGTLRAAAPLPSPSPALHKIGRTLAIIAGIWTLLKVSAGMFLLLMSPPYQDDTVNNWNFRGKVLLHAQELTLTLKRGYDRVETNTVTSYPPSVSLFKANLAALNGGWSEPLVNLPHMLWYLAILGLLFCALRRHVSLGWSLLGVYVFASLPLPLVHGSVAYADLYVAAHALIAMSALLRASGETESARRRSLLLISTLAVALLGFTKNEGITLYLPAFAITFAAAFALWKKSNTQRWNDLLPCAVIAAAVLLPWFAYKWSNGLGFGNAKDVGSLGFGWQPGVIGAVLRNSFLGGSWLLFFPFFIAIFIAGFRKALQPPLLLLTGFLILVFGAQMAAFLFTSLSAEAIYQTGYGRGVVQLLPAACMLAVLLLSTAMRKNENR
jgi:hypothetical protein